ncbi:MAG TPA: hypothetical protein VIF57_15525, partial [Polyangia bacterium]
MLSLSRFARCFGRWPHLTFLMLSVGACAGSSDMVTPGTGGNQSGNSGTSGGTAGTGGTTGTGG